MELLDRYILKHVLGAIVLVLLVLGGLDMLFTLFDELANTNDRYGMGDAMLFVALTLPRHLYDLLPLSSLVGALVGLGALAGSNELMVMQTSGVSVGRIVWAVMKPTAMLMVFALVLGEYVAPPMEMRAEVGKAVASGEQMMVSRNGYWLRDGEHFIHANAIEQGGVLHTVTIYEFDQDKSPLRNLTAERAQFLGQEGAGNLWRLEKVNTVVFNGAGTESGLSGTGAYEESVDLILGLNPELMEVLVMDADNMAISDLYRYATYFNSQGQDANQYFLAFWKKLFQPLTTAALVLVAISFIFGPLRTSTMGSRLFTAICFGLVFVLFQRILSIVSLVYQSEPLIAVLLPILLSAGLGILLLRRAA